MNGFDYQKEEAREHKKWACVDYIEFNCPHCGRLRVEKCVNGKHWCEKCNWVIEDRKYFIPEWRR